MRDTTALTQLASLLADRTRARMLEALMSGVALTATELALAADVTASTASSHLGKLQRAGVLACDQQGRHRYFRLADADVAEVMESLANFADGRTPRAIRT